MPPRRKNVARPVFGETFFVASADGTRIEGWRNQRGSEASADAVPVILSNGLGTVPEAWPALIGDTAGFRVVSWYYRGTFGSARPTDRSHITIDDHVQDLLAVMDAEGIDRAVIACWSMGVNIGFEFARLHPERVAGIMAVAGVPGGTFRAMFGPLQVPRRLRHDLGVTAARAARIVAPLLQPVTRLVPKNRALALIVNHTGFVLPAAEPDVLLPMLEEFMRHDWRWYFTLALGAADHEPMDLGFVHCPVSLVAGRWDVLTSFRDVLKAAAQIPRCDVEILPGSHFLPMEYPTEVALLLRELVARTDLARP